MDTYATIKTIAATALLVGALTSRAGSFVGQPVDFEQISDNYIGAFTIIVTIDGVTVTNAELDSLSTIIVKNDVSSGGSVTTTYKPVTIGRTFAGVDGLNLWFDDVAMGSVQLHDVTITFYDAAYNPVRQTVLYDAYPSRWKTPEMTTVVEDAPLEEFSFVAESILEVTL